SRWLAILEPVAAIRSALPNKCSRRTGVRHLILQLLLAITSTPTAALVTSPGILNSVLQLCSRRRCASTRSWVITMCGRGAGINATARVKLAVFHHPIYSSGKKHGSDLKLRGKLEPLFVRYGVNAVFSGHDHIYERTIPQQGIHYFVTGAGGDARRGDVNLKSPFR